jgi:serine/threonine-protein kinase RsbW
MKTIASITVPAHIDSLMPSLNFVTSFSDVSGFGKKRIGEIELCMEEVLVNIFKYAYPEDSGEIEITCRLAENGALILEVADRGIPFDILTVDDPNVAADVEDRKIGGLGIFFVKQLMDDVQYRRENAQNILTMTVNPE